MMEIKEAIKILKRDGYWGENENVKAFDIVLSFLSKLQDAKMPQPIKLQDLQCNSDVCGGCMQKCESRYVDYDKFLAYYTKKMEEKLDVEQIEKIIIETQGKIIVEHHCPATNKDLAEAIVAKISSQERRGR